jgi:hypothetical protein
MSLWNYKFWFLSLLLCFGGATKVYAYDSHWAHRQLALRSLELWQKEKGAVVTDEQKRWLANGAEEEDYPAIRCLNHFYEPSTERPLVIKGWWLGHTALEWLTSSKWQASGWGGDYAWPTGVAAFKDGDERLAWLILGHNLHLLADLASPAHVHNDDHAEGDGYENYVKEALRKGLVSVPQSASTEPVWCKTGSECLLAMAEYTSRYALTKDWSAVRDFPPGTKWLDGKFYADGRLLGKGDEMSEYAFLDDEVYEAYWRDLAPRVLAYGERMIELYWQEAGRQSESVVIDQKGVVKPKELERPAPVRVIIPKVAIVEIEKPKIMTKPQDVEPNSEIEPDRTIVDESLIIPIEYLRNDWWPMIINGGALPASAAGMGVTESKSNTVIEGAIIPSPSEPSPPTESDNEPETPVEPAPEPTTPGGGSTPTVPEEPAEPVEEVQWPKVNFFNLPSQYSGQLEIFWSASPAGLWHYDLSVGYDQEPMQKLVDGQMLNFYNWTASQDHEVLRLSVLATRNDGVKVASSSQVYFVPD